MLDLRRLERIDLHPRPRLQRALAVSALTPNYGFLPGVRIEVEGAPPDEPVFYAMNHTDRYNYWPFQYWLWRNYDRFTASWVKGKYYEHWFVGWFMQASNNIPTVSRGYIIVRDFVSVMGHRPDEAEYEALRRLTNAAVAGEPAASTEGVPAAILETARDMLGYAFDPRRESYGEAVQALFRKMMRRFVDLNQDALDKGLDLLVFPEGTRSVTLSVGKIGLAQVALRLGATIVPVGCNGSDRVYPGSSPVATKGHIVYRIGEPIRHEDISGLHIDEDYEPFSPEAETKHRAVFERLTDVVMDRINGLLDARHQYAEDRVSVGVQGTSRFV